MIQNILTASIEITFVGSIALFAIQLALGFTRKSAGPVSKYSELNEERLIELYAETLEDAQGEDWLTELQQPVSISFTPDSNGFTVATAEESALVEAATVAIAQYWSRRATDNVVQFKRPAKSTTVADLLKDQSIRQLKKIASQVRLPKYCNNTQAQLVERLLSEVDSARLQQAMSQDAAA